MIPTDSRRAPTGGQNRAAAAALTTLWEGWVEAIRTRLPGAPVPNPGQRAQGLGYPVLSFPYQVPRGALKTHQPTPDSRKAKIPFIGRSGAFLARADLVDLLELRPTSGACARLRKRLQVTG